MAVVTTYVMLYYKGVMRMRIWEYYGNIIMDIWADVVMLDAGDANSVSWRRRCPKSANRAMSISKRWRHPTTSCNWLARMWQQWWLPCIIKKVIMHGRTRNNDTTRMDETCWLGGSCYPKCSSNTCMAWYGFGPGQTWSNIISQPESMWWCWKVFSHR